MARKYVAPGAYIEWNASKFLRMTEAESDQKVRRVARRVTMRAKILAPKGKTEYIYRGELGHSKVWKHRFPGMLRRSIRWVRSRYRKANYLVYANPRIAFYAPWVELGTPSTHKWVRVGGKRRRMRRTPIAAQPFLRPALRSGARMMRFEFKTR